MPEDAEPKPTKAEIALAEVGPCCKKLFVDEYHVAHAAIDVNEHVEIYPIDSSRFRKWARRLIHRQTGIVVDSQTLRMLWLYWLQKQNLTVENQSHSVLE